MNCFSDEVSAWFVEVVQVEVELCDDNSVITVGESSGVGSSVS